MRLILFVLIFCLVHLWAESAEAQVQKAIPPITGKAETGNKKDNPPAPKQEITVNLPSTLNVNVGGKLDVVSQNKEARANPEPNHWADPVTYFTLVLAVANILLWLTTKDLAKEAKIASGIAEKSSDAAKESADAAVKAAMPIVLPLVTDISALLPDGAMAPYRPQVKYALENHGRTPAILVKLVAELCLMRDLPERPPWIDPVSTTDREVISGELKHGGKLARYVTQPLGRDLTANEIEDARRGKGDPQFKRFFLFGYVIYDDVFGYRHIRGFGRKIFLEGGGAVPGQAVRGEERHYNYYHRIDRKTDTPA